jgi:hypothetical protein
VEGKSRKNETHTAGSSGLRNPSRPVAAEGGSKRVLSLASSEGRG